MVRTGNEDAFAFLHGVESRQDDLHEYALVLLCDGMGGYEAGEVAARHEAIESVSKVSKEVVGSFHEAKSPQCRRPRGKAR